MEATRRRVIALLVLLGLVLALIGQYLLSYQRTEWPVALVAYGLAGAVLAMAFFVTRVDWPLAGLTALTPPKMKPSWKWAALVVAVGLVAAASYLAHWHESWYSVVLWVAGVGLGVGTLWVWAPVNRRQRFSWGEFTAVVLIIGIAALLRIYDLEGYPVPMSGDEGCFALEAQRIMEGGWVNPFGTGWFSHPNAHFFLLAGSLHSLGWSLFALRLPSAVLGSLGVGGIYLLARQVFGWETAVASALFAAGWSLPLHISRLALNNSADPLFAALVMTFLARGLTYGRYRDFAISGLALGAGLYFYFGTRLLPLVVSVAVVLTGWRRFALRWQGLLALVFVAALVAGPLLAYFALNPGLFAERMGSDGLFQSGELEREQEWSGKSVPVLLFEHLRQSVLAFNFALDRGYFYTAREPMLGVFSGVLFVLGVLLAVLRIREPRYGVLLMWILLTVLVLGWLVRYPPGYHRYMIAVPAVCLLVGRALVMVLRQLGVALRFTPVLRQGLVIVLAVGLLVVSVGYYTLRYVPSNSFADRNTEIADRAARLMAERGPEYMTYFFGVPLMQLGAFFSVPFLAPDAEWSDVMNEKVQDWSAVARGRGAMFILLPERASLVKWVEERFPGGEWDMAIGRNGDLLFHTYTLPPGEARWGG